MRNKYFTKTLNRRFFQVTLFLTLCSVSLCAQVTIGSGNPPAKGALLDLKDKEAGSNNITSETGGLLLPRVGLVSRTTLQPFIDNDQSFINNSGRVKDVHTGLVVYNLTNDFDKELCPGIYSWNGNLWERLSKPCSFFEFLCSTITTTQYMENSHTPFTRANGVKYNSAIQKTLSSPITHSYGNGLNITIPVQTINQTSNGTFNFTVSGDGTTPLGVYLLPLADLADKLGYEISSSCFVTVNISEPTISLFCDAAKTTADLNTYMDKSVPVVYSLEKVPYVLPAGDIGAAVNGITPSIETEQTLTSYSDVLQVKLKGTPVNPGETSIPITIGGATCSAKVDVAAPFTIACTDVYVTGFVNQDMGDTSPTVQVPYTLSGGSYNLPTGIIGTHYGITARVEAQTLTAPSGTIEVKFEGTPIQTLDKIPFGIDLQGNSCFIHLSVINPPTVCNDGKVAKAFVFSQNNKWFVVTPHGSYNVSSTDQRSVAVVLECNSEEEALRHPDALQYCGNQAGDRCIRLFDRRGAYVAHLHMSQESAGWYNNTGILISGNSCWDNIRAVPGARMQCTSLKTGYLGAVGITGGLGYLGITTQNAVLTDKPLR